MAQLTPALNAPAAVRRDQPWLLPTNRKLRNVQSISLRNLSFGPGSSSRRKRGQTIDDDGVPQSLQSPTKMVALREQKALGHSRSSSDLRSGGRDVDTNGAQVEARLRVDSSLAADTSREHIHSPGPTTPTRPDYKRRRRSTLDWANATPQRRQEQLEDVVNERVVDVFFTLHAPGIEEPIYISEMIERTANPTFRQIDWSACGPGLTRLDRLVLRIWVRDRSGGYWRQFLELKLALSQMHYLGKSLEDIDSPLAQNTILLHLTDGVYTPSPDRVELKTAVPALPSQPALLPSSHLLPTSSFNALLRLSKLDDSIQDALATRDRIAADLEKLLGANEEAFSEQDQLAEAEDRLKTIEYAKKTVEKQVGKARTQQAEKRSSLSIRRKIIDEGVLARKSAHDTMSRIKPEIPGMDDELHVKRKAIQNQRRRICEELQRCYPIQPDPGKALSFRIRGLHLPNSEHLESEPPEVVSAALGHSCSVLQLLSFYLSRPLPYPVTPCGSRSVIHDPISILKTNHPVTSPSTEQSLRAYPLFSKGMPRFRFEYAVFLLNQDIRVLLESAFDVRVVDIRHTLPNLKYLLYVATAGEGDLPARKAGGVKGLLHRPSLRRMGSTDSERSDLSGSTLQANGRPYGAVESLKRIGVRGKAPGGK